MIMFVLVVVQAVLGVAVVVALRLVERYRSSRNIVYLLATGALGIWPVLSAVCAAFLHPVINQVGMSRQSWPFPLSLILRPVLEGRMTIGEWVSLAMSVPQLVQLALILLGVRLAYGGTARQPSSVGSSASGNLPNAEYRDSPSNVGAAMPAGVDSGPRMAPQGVAAEGQPTRQVVVVSATKSMGVSILLTVLFGPLGMLYSTIPGAIIMIICGMVLGVITLGFGLLLVWPIAIIWGAVATSSHNRKLVAGVKQY
jgi:hypothetical protein